jgi:hypothetical protein
MTVPKELPAERWKAAATAQARIRQKVQWEGLLKIRREGG